MKIREHIANWLVPKQPKQQTRMFASAKGSRLTTGLINASNTSQDAELAISLTALRSRSRQLVRDASYAKRAKTIIVNNVIGPGIGMECKVKSVRGELNEPVNDAIEQAWADWTYADNCHTGGTLCFADIERVCMGQIFEAGEIILRVHRRAFGQSNVPIGLEVIESERLADEFTQLTSPLGANVRMGVEIDEFFRPLAYWIRKAHPGDIRNLIGESMVYERVPADQIYHLKVTERIPQTRGVPWLHTAILKMQDMDGYTQAEITAARADSTQLGIIETENPEDDYGSVAEDGQDQLTFEPATFQKAPPGTKINWHTPSRPNAVLDPFMRHMIREISAGLSVPYENLSNDYSQSNYSSSRLAMLDSRDGWKNLQLWWIRNFREPFYEDWLFTAVLSGAIPSVPLNAFSTDMERYQEVKWKPRGWGWIDPVKEVRAYKDAIMGGLTTRTDVIAATADGRDIEDTDETRAEERLAQGDLVYDVDQEVYTQQKQPGETAATPVQPDATQSVDQSQADANNARLQVVR